jgi:hypothetical protein
MPDYGRASLMQAYENRWSHFDAILIARLYGVSESVKNPLPHNGKKIHALRYNERRKESCAYEENQALKILKRPFGYFLGASKKLHAQQGGIEVGIQSV